MRNITNKKVLSKRRFLQGLAVSSFFPNLLMAQTSGSGIIRLVVPYGAGGPTDIVARLIATQLQILLKQTVVVENKPGAGSAIGARFVASSPNDGNTILIGNVSTFAIVPATTKNPGYDPIKSFVPIAQTSDVSSVMVTNSAFPAKTVQEFVTYARANPGKISYGSSGIGNSAHLLGELLQMRAQLNMVHIPYRSGAEMNLAVLSGQVQFAIMDLSASVAQIKDGKLKALALTGISRSNEFPQVPTMIESGYPDIVLRNWTGAAVPAATPPAIVKKLENAFIEILKMPDYQNSIRKMSGDAKPNTGEDFGNLILSDFKKWTDVAKQAGISLE